MSKKREELDLPTCLRVRAARARHNQDHMDSRVYRDAAAKIEALEADNKRLRAIIGTGW